MPKFAANLSMLFSDADFLDRFELAAKAGFQGVEYMSPYTYDKNQLVEKLRNNGLTQVMHNLPMGDFAGGERGIACLPDRIGEFQDGVGMAIEYATALGCKQVNCIAGIAPLGADPETLRRTFVANLKFAAAALEKAGVRLLIEAINTRDIPRFFLTNTRQGLGLLRQVGSKNIALQYDIYHMQIMEGDLALTLERHLKDIGHIQLADNPGRNEPGTGEINYPFLFAHLDRIGYDGWIGCEYKPKTSTEASLNWFDAYRN